MAPAMFPVGAEVEVSCEDEGFHGAWYEARVIRATSGRRPYVVVYDSLVDDSDESRPLSEPVVAANIRPRPPQSPDPQIFTLHQLVDAFYNDGWWAGIVSAVPPEGGGKYSVCFPNTREEMEFFSAELRPRRYWIQGKWVSPDGKETEKVMYSTGTQVEVAYFNGKFPAAWLPAVVVKPIWRNIFLVEYKSLKTEHERSLKEIVDLQDIRPCPPLSSEDRNFDLHDVVEAFYRNGWCRGVVARINAGSRYSIKLMHLEEELEFSHAEVRLPYEWDDGKWVLASQDKSTRQSSSGTESVNHEQYSNASSVADKSKGPLSVMTLSFEKNATLGKSGIYAMNFKNQKIARSTFRSQLESSQPRRKRKKDDEAIEDNAKLLDLLVMARGTKTPSRMGTGFDVTTPAAKERANFHLRSFIIDRFGYSKNLLKDKNMVDPDHMTPPCSGTLLEGANHETLVPAKYGLESLSLHTPLSMIRLSNKGEESSKHGKDGSKNQSGTLHLCCSSSSKGADYTQFPSTNDHQKKKLVSKHQHDKLPDDNGVRQLTVGENRRKTGRPQKIKLSDRNVSLEGHNAKQSDGSSHATIVSEHAKEVGLSAIVDSSCISCEVQPPCHGSKERGSEDSPSALDSQGTLMRENVSTMTDVQQVNKVISEQSVEGHSMSQLEVITQQDCMRGLETLNLAMGSKNAWLVETSNSCMQHSEAGNEEQNGVLAPPLGGPIAKTAPTGTAEAVTEPRCKSPTKKSYLPFEKHSSLWESFESMEILSAMPQQPHFRPLEQYCKEFREGMAIGLMVTFSDLLGRIRKLQITDSRSRFDEGLKALVHLEEHGFNVQGVCARLKELLRMKDNQEQLLEKKSALEGIISGKQKEKYCLNSEIQEIDNAIMNLEQSLMQFHQKKISMLKLKEDNETELVKLQMDAWSVEEVLASAQQDFEGILAAPW
ncbi:DUF724 domain-containing protein 7-like [Phoenix dactylifera]|uniref:DUF724 domain-containing protein 7-like n=1 Tax=Phoenix dactylifera TaxID=42345 RepID=A0A8B7CLU7_PHODC|nr:DUF724 domain-containing protein 7-like [Phoenix dactylifera]